MGLPSDCGRVGCFRLTSTAQLSGRGSGCWLTEEVSDFRIRVLSSGLNIQAAYEWVVC